MFSVFRCKPWKIVSEISLIEDDEVIDLIAVHGIAHRKLPRLIPSSRVVGRILDSTTRLASEYSIWTADIGCILWVSLSDLRSTQKDQDNELCPL